MFDPQGRFVRFIGNKGAGPGEYLSPIGLAVGPDDGVLVQDRDRRIIFFDSAGRFVRETRLKFGAPLTGFGIQHPFAPLSNGNLLMNAHIPTTKLAGIPLFVAGESGELLSAFGPPSVFAALGTTLNARVITLSRDERTVWIAEPRNYLLEEISLADKKVIRSIGVAAPWFDRQPFMTDSQAKAHLSTASVRRLPVRAESDPLPARLEFPPTTGLLDMRSDDRGNMWLLWRAPSKGWRDVVLRYRPRSEGQIVSELFDQMWVTYLDVIDVNRSRLVARHKFEFAAHLIAPSVVGHSFFSDDGGVKVDVWRATLSIP